MFLFDEPLSNLDAQLRVQMRTEIKTLHQRLKTTTIYVTHDQIEAMTMADKIVVMNGGRVEQVGAPLELYDRPENLFVARFIGSPSINLLKGRVEGGAFANEAGRSFTSTQAARLANGTAVVYGVRPENFVLAPDGIPLSVEVIEPTGAETQVFGRLDGEPVVCVFRERIEAQPGTGIRVLPRAESALLFDAASGRRVSP